MRVVGLTGGIATGKTTVSNSLKAAGVAVIDCDEIAHDVVRKGRWAWRRVVSTFGSQVLQSNGELDREALGELVFKNETARRKLNTATHLPVFLETIKQIVRNWALCRTMVVVDMPLLFETKSNKYMKPSILVYCDEKSQLERLMSRNGFTEAHAKSRIASQMPLAEKKKMADILIDNSGSKDALKQKVADVIVQIKLGAAKHLLVSPLACAAWASIGYFLFTM
ncbi:hypothetical protein BSKO_13438 [Bryopsis sp. KO-2023]|nr:hypothetical protein BSKO_13438 [Bryopsis sp. KO-2023]